MSSTNWNNEIQKGERFEFGKNWNNFLSRLNEDMIQSAEIDLKEFFNRESLAGLTFIDIGSGSGLHSLAAWRLGASVTSFDYDEQSYTCTSTLKDRFADNSQNWKVLRGSILDDNFIKELGQFDLVYSWGVLHHTGKMYEAIDNAIDLVAKDGQFYISIYNDQGFASQIWTKIKKLYCTSPKVLKFILLLTVGMYFESRSFIRRLLSFQNPLPFAEWKKRKTERGMSVWIDLIDWVGGYPFEVARPEEIFDFFVERGFQLKKLITCAGGLGCNCFLFTKN